MPRALALALVALTACGGEGGVRAPDAGHVRTDTVAAAANAPQVRQAAAAPVPRPAPPPPPPPPRLFGADMPTDDVIGLLGHAFPQQFKPVGSSSVVFRMKLEGPITGAYRPRSRMHPRGHLAEIAAYRVARLLGMDQVPPVVSRRVARTRLESRLHPDFIDAWDDVRHAIRWDDDGTTEGAAIYWIPDMHELGLDSPAWIERWSRWLSQGENIPANKRALASDLSQAIVFDYLIGNWDRFSGGNLTGTRDGSRIYIRDHNLAFGDPIPDPLHSRMWRRVVQTERFSARQVARLIALTPEALQSELDRDPLSESRRLLTANQLRGVLDRRQAILSHIAELSARLGENRVLSLP